MTQLSFLRLIELTIVYRWKKNYDKL